MPAAQFQQSVSWWCFSPKLMTPEALLQTASQIGYTAVELVEPEFWPLVRDAGLKIASMRGHESISDGLNRRENAARITTELRASIVLAAEWGVPNVICFSGNRAGIDDAAGAAITAETLRLVAPEAEQAGVTLVLELLNSKVDHPDYQADHTAWGIAVCEAVGSPAVKLLYDIYHMQIMEGDVIRTIQTYHSWFGHYHTAGNPGRNEIDGRQELNYPAIMQAIAATGYQGYVGQEFIPLDDPAASLRAAFELCRV